MSALISMRRAIAETLHPNGFRCAAHWGAGLQPFGYGPPLSTPNADLEVSMALSMIDLVVQDHR